MNYSNIIILLARQRSGTNAFRSVLKHHPQIYCFPEVFENPARADWQLAVATSYYTFLDRYTRGNIAKLFPPDDHESLFLDYLDYLRCFTNKPYLLIDVKYNSTHHVTQSWRFITDEPYLFTFIKKYQLRVLNITRRNYLRYYLSEAKAQMTQYWHALDEAVVGREPWYDQRRKSRSGEQETRIMVDTEDLLRTLRLCQSEDRMVYESFLDYPLYSTIDYSDMFPHIGADLSEDVLTRLGQWLNLKMTFPRRRAEYKKQSYLPLSKTIANYSDVARLLSGTEFEHCLRDEEMYHKLPDGSPVG